MEGLEAPWAGTGGQLHTALTFQITSQNVLFAEGLVFLTLA